MSDKKRIEKLEELVRRYQTLIKWINKYTKDIIESQRGRNFLFAIDKLESELQAIDSKEEKPKDWMCHCGDDSTGSMKIWACNICGMEVPDEANPDKLSEKCKQPSPVKSNFMRVKELTDEEWMELPKEEILQLYKNCYQMLQTMSNLSGKKFTNIPTMTTTGEPKTEIDSEEAISTEKKDKIVEYKFEIINSDEPLIPFLNEQSNGRVSPATAERE